jgi:hypothetical protein
MAILVAVLLALGMQTSVWGNPNPEAGLCKDLLSESRARLQTAVDNYYVNIHPVAATISKIQSRFISLKIREKEFVPALVRLDYRGLSIYYLDQNGRLERLWGRSNYFISGAPTGFLNSDTVGPTNLIVHSLGNDGWRISYTNSLYVNSMRIVDATDFSKFIMWDKVPNVVGNNIKDIFPVEVKTRTSGTKTIYWAETNGGNGRLFTYDKEGSAVFLRSEKAVGTDVEKQFGHLKGISSLSEVVTRPDLFIPSLTREYRTYFSEGADQIRRGGRYHYLFR